VAASKGKYFSVLLCRGMELDELSLKDSGSEELAISGGIAKFFQGALGKASAEIFAVM